MTKLLSLLRQRPIQMLLASNLLPLLGALLFGGGVSTLVLLYLLETLLMMLFFGAKIATNTEGKIIEKIVFLPLFCTAYLVLVYAELAFSLVTFYTGHGDGPTFLAMDPQEILDLFVVGVQQEGLWFVGICMTSYFATHLQSYMRNYVRGGGHAQDLEWLVFKPFGRIALVLIVVVPGGAFFFFKGSTWYFIVALAVAKLGADLVSHWAENRKAYQAAMEEAP